jgi:hypothetical protein
MGPVAFAVLLYGMPVFPVYLAWWLRDEVARTLHGGTVAPDR